MHFNLQNLNEFLLAGELFAKLALRLLHPFRRHRHLAPQRFLVNQLFENDHVERALANFRFHTLRNAIVGLRVRKNRLNLRSEEHTSELQSHVNLVCRLLLEKKKKKKNIKSTI